MSMQHTCHSTVLQGTYAIEMFAQGLQYIIAKQGLQYVTAALGEGERIAVFTVQKAIRDSYRNNLFSPEASTLSSHLSAKLLLIKSIQ